MKWNWFGKNGSEGLPQPAPPYAAMDGWVLGRPDQLKGSDLGSYAGQLQDEGYVEQRDGRYVLAWPELYRLLSSDDHASSAALLALPPPSALSPHLASEGSPTDPDFKIRLDHWRAPTGPVWASSTTRTGAVIRWGGGEQLLPEFAYRLLGAMHELSDQGNSWTAEERLLAAGRIQSLARKSGASMDDYLARTDVVVPERLDVQLVSEQVAGVPVVELVPRPEDAPEEWLDAFDSYDQVRSRYDVIRPEGAVTHVALTDQVRDVLQHVKKAPGRRYASLAADAFLHNPYPFLGDHAEDVMPPGRFENARKAAGIVERELLALPADDGWDLMLLDVSGEHEDICETVDQVDQVQQILAAAAQARQAGLPLFRWKTHRVLLSGTSDGSLKQLAAWVTSAAVTPEVFQLAEVFDLEAYSDRVVGFDGKPIHVPFLGRKDASRDWVPENIRLAVASTDPVTGAISTAVLEKSQLRDFDDATGNALVSGKATVQVPGTSMEIPAQEAREWLDAFGKAGKQKPIAPTVPKAPKPAGKTALRILHNIEALEYGGDVALPPLEQAMPVLPAALSDGIELKAHQQFGVAWLQHRFNQRELGMRGALLADDMGLGKTLQCLCLMAWYRETQAQPHPCLVVAPVSLLENWKAEIEKFLDGSQGATMLLYGQELARHRLPSSQMDEGVRTMGVKKLLRPGFTGDAAFVLTTYETLRDYELTFGRQSWGVLVCDEAQKIKTPGALVTRSAKAMKAEFKIACTGTPVENSLADLWCLFDFFQPGLLGSLSEFTKTFRKSIELREDDHSTQVEKLRAAIEPWVLRRMKSEVAELPPKIDELHELADPATRSLPMSDLQRKLYGDAVVSYKLAKDRAEEAGEQSGTMTLALLHQLRMICANPSAVAHGGSDRLSIAESIQHSPKLQWLLRQLEKIKEDQEKAIVFTEYREIQRLLQRTIVERFGGDVSIVNGATTVDSLNDASRQKVIDRFQERPGFAVIILSTTAVGFGVNIQKANHVIHFTRPWNPAKEDQATDRAYRIGQEKPVWVYCPTVVGDGYESFEQRLADRLAQKRALSHDLLAPEQAVSWTDFEDLVS